ncbi:unnamed protein product [Arabidopsis thaliana]|uniref:Uncharacterized protein n=1 Tax=Arabidopsis thaliana TaxID=3702 RepID=A0A654EMH8_ARATH|nr:unnamed protein product [Arabidopsis thaliana]
MDGLKISCPVDVSLPAKLMGSEGCGGGVRVSSNKADNNCDKARVSIGVNSSIERCSSASINKKGAGSSSGASDSSLWRKLMHSHDFVHDRLTKLRVDNSSEPQNGYSPIASPESAESPRKRGKLSRSSSGNGTPRRTKLILLDETVRTQRDNDTKEICGQGSTSCLDKPFVVKQRSTYNGKRGDKRISKVPVRTLSTINSATGENAFFGAYGLKPAINDVTKLVEDFSLKSLLEGSYECPSLGKDKMKKSENTNNTLLSVVKNVWSILPTKRPVQSQSSTELDTCLSRTLGSPPSSISATLPNSENIDKVNALDGDLSSSSKDHCINSEIPSTPLSFPLCDAGDVLKRLGLPPSKDLDSLLQDASKPSHNSKNNLDQQRSAKPPHSGLPHFPWSQPFNGSSRTNSEAAKLVTCKTLCQGRWLRIADTSMSSPEGITDNFANLESLTFNQNLVPPLLKQTITGVKTSQTKFANTISCQCAEASVSTLQNSFFVPKEPEGSPDVEDDALSCPQLLEAARTLCDIAVQSANHDNPNGILRWPKKLSQKSMKARKSKLIEKPLERHRTTVSSIDLNSSNNNNNKNHVRKDSAAEHNHHHHHHHPKPSKRLKLSTMENKKRSFPSSSSPIESDRKHSSSSKFKNHSRMMLPPPPPTRTLQKSSTYPQKARKFP